MRTFPSSPPKSKRKYDLYELYLFCWLSTAYDSIGRAIRRDRRNTAIVRVINNEVELSALQI